jgi:hypothetical protein
MNPMMGVRKPDRFLSVRESTRESGDTYSSPFNISKTEESQGFPAYEPDRFHEVDILNMLV